ncbi:hypothetical protein C0585_05905 [Candidatus Woesearchaeota archaeon]|nr:MAG: hypothetical protein C0585_05905 [Candidatus Woesearchaeota archaeon]
MKTPELETINLFSKDLTLNLTINQISKELNKSYAFTNKYVRDFLDEGILSRKIVGSAILCSLNFSNEKTLGLLMMNSIDDKMNFMKKSNPKMLSLSIQLASTPTLKSLFLLNNKFHIICEDKKLASDYFDSISKTINKNITLLDQNEFKLGVKGFDLKKITILEGYERFWKLISEII